MPGQVPRHRVIVSGTVCQEIVEHLEGRGGTIGGHKVASTLENFNLKFKIKKNSEGDGLLHIVFLSILHVLRVSEQGL